MSQLNLKQILSGDNLSLVVDKLNYNFDQIILNGGGPDGLRGLLGAPGLPGLQGKIGNTGSTGPHGTYIFADGASPSIYPFGTGGEALPRIGDIFIETDPTYLVIWELNATGGTGTYWNAVETISAPTGAWKTVVHQSAGSGPDYTDIVNDSLIASKLFVGSTSSFITGADPSDVPYMFSTSFVDTLVSSLSLPSQYADSLATFASTRNQIRIMSNNLAGATGALGGTGYGVPSIQTNRGGVVHSMGPAIVTGATVQVYRIINADSVGDKFFSMGLNSARGTMLLYGDMQNRAGIGIAEFEPIVAGLSVARSIAVGSAGSFYNAPTFKGAIGAVIEGNLAIGVNNNTYSTGTFFGATNSTILIDTNVSVGTPNLSSITLASDSISTTNTNYWKLSHDAYKNVLNTNYSSLSLVGYKTGVQTAGVGASANVLWMSLTGSSTYVRPVIGVNNIDSFSLVEVGASANRVSIGEAYGTISDSYISNYIGFNLHRSPVLNNWLRRGDGISNAGKAIWSGLTGGLNISYVGTTGTSQVLGMTDNQIVQNTRFTVDRGSIRISDISQTDILLGATGVGLYVGFGPSGTTGSGDYINNWRRTVAIFGRGPEAANFGTPAIYAVNGATQTFAIISDNSSSVLPQYSFYGSDTHGLYLAEGTTVNPGAFTSSALSLGLAVGGTSAISINGDSTGNIRVGIQNRNPLGRFQIGNSIVIHDGSTRFIGDNIFWNGSALKRISGSTAYGATQEGFVRQTFYETGLSGPYIASRFRNIGTVYGIEVGNPGSTVTDNSTLSPSGKNFKGVLISPPLAGPTSTSTLNPSGYGYVNLSDNVPQMSIGIPLDLSYGSTAGSDSATSAKRGTLAIASQLRIKQTVDGPLFGGFTAEDFYNIGLYSSDGNPVAGIHSGGGAEGATNSFGLFFMGKTGDAILEDIPILTSVSNNNLTTKYQKITQFGSSFRVGINSDLSNWPTSTLDGLSMYSSDAWDIAPLVVTGTNDYFTGLTGAVHPAGIFKGSLIIDQSAFGYQTGRNEGLFIKDSTIWTGAQGNQVGGTRTGPISSDSYVGDWGIQYWKTSNDPTGGTQAGLAFFKPGISSNRLFIDDLGGVGIDTNSFAWTGGGSGVYNYHNASSTTWVAFSGGGRSALAVNGGISCTYIFTSSDIRIKENIEILPDSLSKIMLLKPSTYNLIANPNILSVGFIAQEVESLFPEVVRTFEDPELEGGRKTIDYNSFIPILTKGMQEQQTIIDEKDKQIKNLESKLSKIEELLAKHNIV